MRRPSRGQRGFTITEVVVVIGIVAVLIGTLIPAIANARRAADRTSCANNLKQLILGLHNYECHHGSLPAGCLNPTGPIHNRPEGLHASWVVHLLPYIEQSGLAGSIDTSLSVYDPANRATMTQVSSLHCKADAGAKAAGVKPGVSSYAACHHDVEAPIDVDNHGVMYLNSRVRHEDVLDGSSQTLFLGEKRTAPHDLGWGSGTRATLRNTGTPLNGPPPDAPDAVGGFGSGHPGGANVAMGDGAVRFLSDRIDPSILRLLGHRADGEPISDDALLPRPAVPRDGPPGGQPRNW